MVQKRLCECVLFSVYVLVARYCRKKNACITTFLHQYIVWFVFLVRQQWIVHEDAALANRLQDNECECEKIFSKT